MQIIKYVCTIDIFLSSVNLPWLQFMKILDNHIFVVNVKLCKQILRYFVTINSGLVYYKRFCLQLFIIIRFNVLSKVARELFSCGVVQLTA